jgi:hypothetical protein
VRPPVVRPVRGQQAERLARHADPQLSRPPPTAAQVGMRLDANTSVPSAKMTGSTSSKSSRCRSSSGSGCPSGLPGRAGRGRRPGRPALRQRPQVGPVEPDRSTAGTGRRGRRPCGRRTRPFRRPATRPGSSRRSGCRRRAAASPT